MFKGLSNFASLLRQAQQMGGRMQEITAKLQQERVQGSAGGGLVEVEMNGMGDMLRLKIDPSLMEKGDHEMIEDLVPAAVNEAHGRAKELYADAMKSMTEGLDVPGLSDALESMTGGGPSPESPPSTS